MRNYLLSLILIAVQVVTPLVAVAQVTTPTTAGTLGFKNYVTNPSCLVSGRNITATGTATAATRSTSAIGEGPTACSLTWNATGDKQRFLVGTLAKNLQTGFCSADFSYAGTGMSGVKAYVEQNTGSGFVKVSPEVQLQNTTSSTSPIAVSIPGVSCGGSTVTQTAVTLELTGASTITGFATDVRYGKNLNIGSVQAPSIFGTATWTGTTNCLWSSASTSFVDFSADADCQFPITTGNVSAVGTKIPAIQLPSMPVGYYEFTTTQVLYVSAPGTGDTSCKLRFFDGTTNLGDTYTTRVSAQPTSNPLNIVLGRLDVTTPRSNVTISLQPQIAGNASTCYLDNSSVVNPINIVVRYYPSQSSQIITPSFGNGWMAKQWSATASQSIGGGVAPTATRTIPSQPGWATYQLFGAAQNDSAQTLSVTGYLPSGEYRVSYNGLLRATTPGNATPSQCVYEIFDGTNVIASSYSEPQLQASTSYGEINFIGGSFRVTSAGTKTYSLRVAKRGGSTAGSCNVFSESDLPAVLQIQPASQAVLPTLIEPKIYVLAEGSTQAINNSRPNLVHGTVAYTTNPSVYNASTGVFTCPRNGMLKLRVSVQTGATGINAGGAIEVNVTRSGNIGKSIAHTRAAATQAYLQFTGSGSTPCNTGEAVNLRIYSDTTSQLNNSPGINWSEWEFE